MCLRWTANSSQPRFPRMDPRTVRLTSSKWPPARNLSDVVPRVNFATAGGSLEWKADSSGFYYTRYPQGNERPPEDANFYQQVYFHQLGTDSKQDTYVIGKEFPRIAEIQLHASDDGQWLIAAVANGDGGSSRTTSWTRPATGPRSRILRTELWPSNPVRTPRFTCSPAKTRRAARSCAFRCHTWISPGPGS